MKLLSTRGGTPMPKIKALAETHPQLAKEAFGFNPKTWHHSHARMSWKCKAGHIYHSKITSRKQGLGCPYCANKKIFLGFNDLKTLFPAIAKEAFNFDPATTFSRSHRMVYWKCSKDHIYKMRIFHRTTGSGCPCCMGRKKSVSEKSFAKSRKG